MMNGLSDLMESVVEDEMYTKVEICKDVMKLMKLVEDHTPELSDLRKAMNI
ncbi:hypothetical protein GI364_24755 (plasmid) [Alicyclobacillus sp. SO9]|nr:hypothetical protein GI364_24755 [Alicyclobacillus sp. SO9]